MVFCFIISKKVLRSQMSILNLHTWRNTHMAQRGATPPQMRIIIMTDKTIAQRIETLMTFYASYSQEADRVFEVAEEEKDDVRYKRDLYARWIKEDLDALKALGIDIKGFDYITK